VAMSEAFVICISSDAEKLLDTIASDRRDDAELGPNRLVATSDMSPFLAAERT
jgi:hypothetical protein